MLLCLFILNRMSFVLWCGTWTKLNSFLLLFAFFHIYYPPSTSPSTNIFFLKHSCRTSKTRIEPKWHLIISHNVFCVCLFYISMTLFLHFTLSVFFFVFFFALNISENLIVVYYTETRHKFTRRCISHEKFHLWYWKNILLS